ncbi:MAG: hypothetical protein ACLSDI_07425 [Oscillospiraceae bacterium]
MQANIRRIVSILVAVMFCVACFTGCGSSNSNGGSDTASVDVKNAKTIADLKGAKIAAQAGTFHADALSQIPDVQSSTYPEFADLLTALKSGAIDGYIAEEPTALSVCGSNEELTYLPFKNNDTGFTATAADVGIAIGLKKGNALRDQINTVLAEITEEQKSQLMEQIVTLASGGAVTEFAVHCDARPPRPVRSRSAWSALTSRTTGPIPTAAPLVPFLSAAKASMACTPTAMMSRSPSMLPTVLA